MCVTKQAIVGTEWLINFVIFHVNEKIIFYAIMTLMITLILAPESSHFLFVCDLVKLPFHILEIAPV